MATSGPSGTRSTPASSATWRGCAPSAACTGLTVWGEPSPYHATVELSYLAFARFSWDPTLTWERFLAEDAAPLLGGVEAADEFVRHRRGARRAPGAAARAARRRCARPSWPTAPATRPAVAGSRWRTRSPGASTWAPDDAIGGPPCSDGRASRHVLLEAEDLAQPGHALGGSSSVKHSRRLGRLRAVGGTFPGLGPTAPERSRRAAR